MYSVRLVCKREIPRETGFALHQLYKAARADQLSVREKDSTACKV